jgi:SAM-dependent methyltransferase
MSSANAAFDLCTSAEVFEHVEDDLAGFREVRRVLRGGGVFVFTVPIASAPRTVVRAIRRNGRIEHLLPPEYHLDTIRGENTVLCFRDYGQDLPSRLISAGFAAAEIRPVDCAAWWSLGRPVVLARAGRDSPSAPPPAPAADARQDRL